MHLVPPQTTISIPLILRLVHPHSLQPPTICRRTEGGRERDRWWWRWSSGGGGAGVETLVAAHWTTISEPQQKTLTRANSMVPRTQHAERSNKNGSHKLGQVRNFSNKTEWLAFPLVQNKTTKYKSHRFRNVRKHTILRSTTCIRCHYSATA